MSKVDQLIEKSRHAQHRYETFDQNRVNEVVTAVAWSLVHPERNRELSQLAVKMTGLGRVEDKIIKNERKTLGLLRDLQDVKTVGVISSDSMKGITEIARPLGIVGALTPSTNPLATPLNNTINALKCRNSIILAPSPAGETVCRRLLKYIHAELSRVGAPLELVQQLYGTVDKASTRELMEKVDRVVVTGTQSNVRAAYSSGTAAIGVGAGNAVVIVDESADLANAASMISQSKTFDYATSCSSENAVIIIGEVHNKMIEFLAQKGGVMLDEQEKRLLESSLWLDGHLNRDMLAKNPRTLCERSGLKRKELQDSAFLMIQEEGIGSGFPFSGEKLTPVLTVYGSSDFEQAVSIASKILDYQGKGHSVGLHTSFIGRATELGEQLPVCRVIVNQPHCFATGGSFENGLPFSLSMGCGSWGQNSIDDNLNYRHFLNITRVALPIKPSKVSVYEMFSEYLSKYEI